MLTRPADDVCLELGARAHRLLRTNTPVLTLEREVPNWITAVDATAIRRRSGQARGAGEDSPVAAREVAAVWRDLQNGSHAAEASALRFAYALVARFIYGVAYETNPFRLCVDNEDAANQLWRRPPMDGGELRRARDELLDAIRRLRVYRDGDTAAPHKPLLLLLTLAGYANGTARRTTLFSDLESRLSKLITGFSSFSAEAEPQEPFWRLKSSGVWYVKDPGGSTADATSPPGIRYLREQKVSAGFVDHIHRVLWDDEALPSDVIAELLSQHFPAEQHPALLKAVGLESAQIPRRMLSLR